jgi:hypothetical protein
MAAIVPTVVYFRVTLGPATAQRRQSTPAGIRQICAGAGRGFVFAGICRTRERPQDSLVGRMA